MADNKLLLRRDADEDFLPEDDPLAELARIVGFEPTPTIKPHAVAPRREPEFDLEDELLKEFEQYEAPEPVSVHARAEAQPYRTEPVCESDPEPAYMPEVEPEPVSDPAPFVLQEVAKPEEHAAAQDTVRPESHPVFELEDEILREFAAFDARPVSMADPVSSPVTAQVVRQEPVFDESVLEDDIQSELYDMPDVAIAASHVGQADIVDDFADAEPQPASDFAAQHAIEGDGAFTQEPPAPELEEAAFAPVQAASEPEPEYAAEDATYWAAVEQEASAYRAAVAAANVSHVEEPGDVGADRHVADTGIETEAQVEHIEEAPASVLAAAPGHDVAQSAPATGEHVSLSVEDIALEAEAARPSGSAYDIDALLAEVERYPVGNGTSRWGVQAKAVSPETVAPPQASGIAETVRENDLAPEEPKFDVVEQAPLAYAPHPAQAEEAVAEDDVHFDENSFELDFGDIELDLAELHDIDVTASAEALSAVAEAEVASSEALSSDIAAADIGRAQAYATRVTEPTPREDYSSLPFDPSQIVLEEERVETLAEMDVPEIPVGHDEEKPAAHAEYDLDIDADMANLFAGTASQASNQPQPTRSAPHGDTQFATAQVQPPQNPEMELDEFERALEEDFRRSFAENRNAGTPDRVALTPAYRPQRAVRGRRTWALLGGSAIAIVLFGGAGLYAFISGDATLLTSSEPKIILADTDPVRIVPDDRGGKQVPNQNKAVYDRVSGDTMQVATQESLLSSVEEPIDVVQRTLMPENLPMDDDSMAAATPTEDTADPRLLPEEERDRMTTTNKVTSGVSPRKVKTMVVKPDGTLVAREDTVEDLEQQATNDAELMKIAQKAAQDAAIPAATAEDEIAKAIESVPERLVPGDQPIEASEVPLKPVETVTVPPIEQEADPVVAEPLAAENSAQPAVPADAATVAEENPVAEQPVQEQTVQKQIAAETEAIEPAPTDVASETPAERSLPAADAQALDAMAAAADAEVADAPVRAVKTSKIMPVPENRPVDQPVTVVGRVTDQGNVRDAAAKQQQVAALDAEQAAQTAAVPAGSYVIQIASLPSEAEAQTSYAKLSTKFASVIGGRGVDIKRAEIKNKGTYYRVRIPAGSKQEAQELCSQYKQAGGSCLVSR